MARLCRQHMGVVVEGNGEGTLKFRSQALDLRPDAGPGVFLRPHQLLAKRGQARAPAFFPDDQCVLEFGLPAFQFTPYMAIRVAHALGGLADGAGAPDSRQQHEQRVVQMGCSARCRPVGAAETVVKLDAQHM